ncbi:hypothetical protein ACQWG0_25625, partial [Salmonella enterica subsp. enterica serovar Infantis]
FFISYQNTNILFSSLFLRSFLSFVFPGLPSPTTPPGGSAAKTTTPPPAGLKNITKLPPRYQIN